MISTRFKFIFLHVPKTAGNSIQEILLPYSDDRKVLSTHQDGVNRFEVCGPITTSKHDSLSLYAQHLGEKLKNYRVIISVRDPFSRAISYFFSPHRWATQDVHGVWTVQKPVWSESDFRKFVETEIRPMTSYLSLGYDQLAKADQIIHFETLQSDLQRCIFELKIPVMDFSIPHANRSAATENLIRSVLCRSDLRRFVYDRFGSDVTLFGY